MIWRTLHATFGKLENQTLVLDKGLNFIHAPNESGKSTWCAFLRTMFYGFPPRARGALADKNRFSPWSGAPMEGSLDLEELKDALNSFLSRLSHRDRVLFLGRYWYGSPYKELAQQTGLTENNAMVRVSRLREKLRTHLKKKGVLE